MWKEEFARNVLLTFYVDFVHSVKKLKKWEYHSFLLLKLERILESFIKCKMFLVIWRCVWKTPIISILFSDVQFIA